jgi:hypothetical protein
MDEEHIGRLWWALLAGVIAFTVALLVGQALFS